LPEEVKALKKKKQASQAVLVSGFLDTIKHSQKAFGSL